MAREMLLAALEDLSQEQLKRFRHKLRDAPMDGRSIPWGRLERADAVDLTEQLTHFYGPEPALDVARKTLKKADVRDVAARLKAQRLHRELEGGWGVSLARVQLSCAIQASGQRCPPPFFPVPQDSTPTPRALSTNLRVPGLRLDAPERESDAPYYTLPSPPTTHSVGLTSGFPFQGSAPALQRCFPCLVSLSPWKAQVPSGPGREWGKSVAGPLGGSLHLVSGRTERQCEAGKGAE